jgi:sodium/bile acid cotransporter 7
VVVSLVLLAIVIAINVFVARRCGFNKADEITIVFCGSKKSLANGIPMANILFPTSILGIMVLPLMIFHQIQLMVCAVLARRYKRQTEAFRRRKKPRRRSLTRFLQGLTSSVSPSVLISSVNAISSPRWPAGN